MSRPFETVRRNVKRLEQDGFCRVETSGAVLAADALERPEVAALAAHAHDCLVRFIDTMVALRAVRDPKAEYFDYEPDAVLLAATDLLLAIAESNRPTHATFDDLVIFSAAYALNHRSITTTANLDRNIRDETHAVPPGLLCGARPSVIARTMGLSESTVRRRMNAMVGRQMVLQDGRYYVSTDWMNTDQAIAVSRNSLFRTQRMMVNLAQSGFPFGDIRQAYRNGGPPPLIAFE